MLIIWKNFGENNEKNREFEKKVMNNGKIRWKKLN